ncbi:MAG: hypothetical protein LBL46_03620 [Rickettsiales bacterium]|jgi:hypothetical protein|nr:hypothetical protein [Rickettsiales bacterium]
MDASQQLESAYQTKTKNHRAVSMYAAGFGLTRGDMSALAGKSIKLIGGGASPVLTQLEENGIFPTAVVNIDPFAPPQDNPRQTLIRENFFDYDGWKDQDDEVWALYSLPHYSYTEIQVKKFYAKAILGLAPGGHLRVYPIAAGLGIDVDHIKPLLEPSRIESAYRDFANDLHAAFPKLGLQEKHSPRVLKSDSLQQTDLEKYYEMLAAKPAADAKKSSGGIRLGEISSVVFTAPADKTKLNSWLQKYLATLKVMEMTEAKNAAMRLSAAKGRDII